MTDYLEVLLEEQEQEEVRQTLEWKRPVLSLPVRAAAGEEGTSLFEWVQGRQSGAVQTSTDAYGAAATWMRTSGNLRVQEDEQTRRDRMSQIGTGTFEHQGPTWAEQSAIQPLTAEMGRLRRAVQQAGKQVSRWVSHGPGMTDGGISALGKTEMFRPRAADYAALVDAAFARDARRYDGPLGLL